MWHQQHKICRNVSRRNRNVGFISSADSSSVYVKYYICGVWVFSNLLNFMKNLSQLLNYAEGT
jgi:hypothetical protein